jgi:hypothetical protein
MSRGLCGYFAYVHLERARGDWERDELASDAAVNHPGWIGQMGGIFMAGRCYGAGRECDTGKPGHGGRRRLIAVRAPAKRSGLHPLIETR